MRICAYVCWVDGWMSAIKSRDVFLFISNCFGGMRFTKKKKPTNMQNSKWSFAAALRISRLKYFFIIVKKSCVFDSCDNPIRGRNALNKKKYKKSPCQTFPNTQKQPPHTYLNGNTFAVRCIVSNNWKCNYLQPFELATSQSTHLRIYSTRKMRI